jgi:hypothetical protein
MVLFYFYTLPAYTPLLVAAFETAGLDTKGIFSDISIQ